MKMEKQNHLLWAAMVLVFHDTMAAVAEQFNDEKGLVWPVSVAPFDVHLIAVNMKDETQV